MTYNDVLARELKADVKVLIRDYFKSHEDEQQFPRELLYQFIEQFDIFSLLLDSQDSVLRTEFLTFIRLISKDFPAFFCCSTNSGMLWYLSYFTIWESGTKIALCRTISKGRNLSWLGIF